MISPEATKLFTYLRSVETVPPGSIAEQRAGFDASVAKVPLPDGVSDEAVVGPGFTGLWLRPEGAPGDAAILHLHGGGFVLGSTTSHKPMLSHMAATAGVSVLAIDYRLSPEHVWPAALDDALAAYRWLLEQGFAAGRITVSGDSAGGGLALALLIRLKGEGLPQPASAVLISPWLDLRLVSDSISRNAAADPLMNLDQVRGMAEAYLGDLPADDPRGSPVLGDLAGIAPVYVQTSDVDILEDDAHLLAERGRAAGADVTLDSWPGMIHVWHAFAHIIPEAREAFAKIGAFIGSRLHREG